MTGINTTLGHVFVCCCCYKRYTVKLTVCTLCQWQLHSYFKKININKINESTGFVLVVVHYTFAVKNYSTRIQGYIIMSTHLFMVEQRCFRVTGHWTRKQHSSTQNGLVA